MKIKIKIMSILLIVLCSFLGALAQFSFKEAASYSSNKDILAVMLNPYLLLGYLFYGISLLLLTIALMKGEISISYPFISLTFIWVTLFTPMIFPSENFNYVKLIGVLFIVSGIFTISFGGNSEN